MAALMYVDHEEYDALILRKSYTDLSLPGALLDMSKDWLMDSPAHWNQLEHRWTFPSGATLSFGYVDTHDAVYRYQSSELSFIAIDELTQIPEHTYTYMFSRLRQKRESEIPLRYYSASNPPQSSVGEYVYYRFIDGARPRHFIDPTTGMQYIHFYEKEDSDGIRAYVPALLDDNPHVHESYRESLKRLDYVTRRQLEQGDWFVRPTGGIFEKEWFGKTFAPSDKAYAAKNMDDTIISADIAMKDKETNDYTAFQAWGRKDANYYLLDALRGKWVYPIMKQKFLMFCERNPDITRKVVEDKAAGISLLQDLKDEVSGLLAYNPGTKSKAERAKLVSPLFEAGNVYLPSHRAFTKEYVEELVSWDGTGKSGFDDQLDSTSMALIKLKKRSGRFFAGVI
jgi:predicted phage terminase large subunit-like protein